MDLKEMAIRLENFPSVVYSGHPKKRFHSLAKRFFIALRNEMGVSVEDADVSSNMGGVAVSGEIILHTDKVYIQISQFRSRTDVFWRWCDGRRDFTGEQNNWCKVTDLCDLSLIYMFRKRHSG